MSLTPRLSSGHYLQDNKETYEIFIAGHRNIIKTALLGVLTSKSTCHSETQKGESIEEDIGPLDVKVNFINAERRFEVRYKDTCDDDSYLELMPETILKGIHAVNIIFDWSDESSMNIVINVLKYAIYKQKELPIFLVGCNIDLVEIKDLLNRRRGIEFLKGLCKNVYSFDLPKCRTDEHSIMDVIETAFHKLLMNHKHRVSNFYANKNQSPIKTRLVTDHHSRHKYCVSKNTSSYSPSKQSSIDIHNPVNFYSPQLAGMPESQDILSDSESVYKDLQEIKESNRFIVDACFDNPVDLESTDEVSCKRRLSIKHEWHTIDNKKIKCIAKPSLTATLKATLINLLSSVNICPKKTKQ